MLLARGATPRAPRPHPELPAQRLTLSPHYPTRHVPPNHLCPIQLCFQQSYEPGWGREASRTSAMPSSPRPLGAQTVKSIGSPGHPPPWGQEDCTSVQYHYITTRPQNSVADKEVLSSVAWVGWAGLAWAPSGSHVQLEGWLDGSHLEVGSSCWRGRPALYVVTHAGQTAACGGPRVRQEGEGRSCSLSYLLQFTGQGMS